MNVRKDLVIAVLLGFFLAITLYPKVTGVGEYDPWSDINSDGKMRVDDILDVALRFGANGDPTRNVTVTNWPNSPTTTVWWYEPVPSSTASNWYNRSGFTTLHILMQAVNIPTGSLTVYVYGYIPDPGSSGYAPIAAYSIVLSASSSTASISIPVPSDHFRFVVYPSGTTTSNIYLGFHLTWP